MGFNFCLPNFKHTHRRSQGCTVGAQGKGRTVMGWNWSGQTPEAKPPPTVGHLRETGREVSWLMLLWGPVLHLLLLFLSPTSPLWQLIWKPPMFIGVWCRQSQKQGHRCFPASLHSAAPRGSHANLVAFRSNIQKVKSHEHQYEAQQ